MILIDYSQVAISNIMSFRQDLIAAENSGDSKGAEDIIRHCILSSLKMYKKRFGKEYGDLVVCCDSYNYWRKDYHLNEQVLVKRMICHGMFYLL
jgi:hypothetical protein